LDTLVWLVANDPRVAFRAVEVGSGPRWNGLAACASAAPTVGTTVAMVAVPADG
jgi:hypothetical protein